jgi:hypothetical protein
VDIDHEDGNHNDNLPESLQALCTHCHSRKTHLSKEHMNPGEVGPGAGDVAAPGLVDLRE